jgi:hypothetical protein
MDFAAVRLAFAPAKTGVPQTPTAATATILRSAARYAELKNLLKVISDHDACCPSDLARILPR